jgi:hypothetical protein
MFVFSLTVILTLTEFRKPPLTFASSVPTRKRPLFRFPFQLKITLKISHGTYYQRLRDITNSVAPEPEGPSPNSQQPATGPYPEPAESTPHPQPITPRSITEVILKSA